MLPAYDDYTTTRNYREDVDKIDKQKEKNRPAKSPSKWKVLGETDEVEECCCGGGAPPPDG